MTIGSVSGSGPTIGVGPMSHDVGDIAFMVALLEVERLDAEIGARLKDIKALNAIRRAYSERIAELQRLVDQCDDRGRVRVPLSKAARGEYVWDPRANDGRGGVVLRSDGTDLLGNGKYSVQRADGTIVRWRDLGARFPLIADRPAETRDRAEAERLAARFGGTVMVTVTRDQLVGEMETLRSRMDNLSSDAEIGMLGLNRLLSRRNQILQLASNVMSSQHQTAMGIIANMKV